MWVGAPHRVDGMPVNLRAIMAKLSSRQAMRSKETTNKTSWRVLTLLGTQKYTRQASSSRNTSNRERLMSCATVTEIAVIARYSRSGRLMLSEERASAFLLTSERVNQETYNPARAMVVAEMLNPPKAPSAASSSR